MPIGSKWGLNINLPGEVEPQEPSSIDRFFWSKGTKMMGYVGSDWRLALLIISTSLSITALVFGILSLTVHTFPHVLTLIFGSLAGGSLLTTAIAYLRNKRVNPIEVRMSPSGRRLLIRIGQHIGWYDHDAVHNNRGNQWHNWWQSVIGYKTASNVLTKPSAEVLESGCSSYNRIQGLLRLAKESKGRGSAMIPQIQAAGDEAMISLINQVALLEETPETQAAIYSQCQIQTEKLKELADRFEEVTTGPVTLTDQLASSTVMDNVLDQLRLEAQAHEELRIMDRTE